MQCSLLRRIGFVAGKSKIGIGVLFLFAFACVGAQDTDRGEVEVETLPIVSDNWIGYEIGLSPGKTTYIGDFKIAGPNDKYVEPKYDPNAENVPDTSPGSFVIGDPKTRKMYRVDMPPEDLLAIAEHAKKRGFDQPHFGDIPVENPVEEEFIEKGWSSGVDNRIHRGIAYYPANSWPIRTIGQQKQDGSTETTNGHCTASFIGSAGNSNMRYIISAGHCYWSTSTGAYLDPDFWPRQDRCRDRYGNNVANCDQSPYGEWDGAEWVMYSYFVDNCAGLSSLGGTCIANDIAVQRVYRVGTASFPGAMGYDDARDDFLNSKSKYHRGYPNCGGGGDPVPPSPEVCQHRTLYGDGTHIVGTDDYPDGDGWDRRLRFGSDTSGGHSGGPLFFYDAGGYYTYGVDSSEMCTGSACGSNTTPNYARRITPEWRGIMENFW